ncbi:unnamed protein product [Ceratitis capitata]|uniref:(Mediterranean fruit fly) hypothetical protein n=1 Tax=Ceratitis capitata TaxID=7213 RepID=A0A811TZ46_CERCA|nr:unnamed protein product [Ceratitis capitata]
MQVECNVCQHSESGHSNSSRGVGRMRNAFATPPRTASVHAQVQSSAVPPIDQLSSNGMCVAPRTYQKCWVLMKRNVMDAVCWPAGSSLSLVHPHATSFDKHRAPMTLPTHRRKTRRTLVGHKHSQKLSIEVTLGSRTHEKKLHNNAIKENREKNKSKR